MALPKGVTPKYAIFTTDREFADYTIDNYVRSHNCKCEKRIRSTYDSYAVMEDGTKYQWIKPNDTARGHKCSVGVVDLGTCTIDFIREQIPYICLFAEPEKNNCVFRDSTNTKDSKPYDLHTLIDRLQKIEALIGNVEKLGYNDMEYGWQRIAYLDASKEQIVFDTDY